MLNQFCSQKNTEKISFPIFAFKNKLPLQFKERVKLFCVVQKKKKAEIYMQKSARCVILLSWQWRKFYLYKSFMLLKRASLTNLFSVKALILPNKRQNFVVIIHHIKKEVLELHFFQDTYYTYASWCDPPTHVQQHIQRSLLKFGTGYVIYFYKSHQTN